MCLLMAKVLPIYSGDYRFAWSRTMPDLFLRLLSYNGCVLYLTASSKLFGFLFPLCLLFSLCCWLRCCRTHIPVQFRRSHYPLMSTSTIVFSCHRPFSVKVTRIQIFSVINSGGPDLRYSLNILRS